MKSRWIFGPDKIYYVIYRGKGRARCKLETMTIEISVTIRMNRRKISTECDVRLVCFEGILKRFFFFPFFILIKNKMLEIKYIDRRSNQLAISI